MIALGIESTAHTAGVGVIDSGVQGPGSVLVNLTSSYSPASGGIHPREAAVHHGQALPGLIGDALEALGDQGLGGKDIGLVAFSRGPGLGPCLRTGAVAARALSVSLGVPIIGVNHCVAHLEIGMRLFPGCSDPVLLYASGGNTQVIAFTAGRYRVFGETLDIGAGNMLDKFARESGIPFPGGPRIEDLASRGSRYIPLPYSVKGMDMAFSGILTAALAIRKKERMEDICMSLQETVFSMLVEVTERAVAHTGKGSVLLGGGVACNRRLASMVSSMASERGIDFYLPPASLCVDNGAMIANLGAMMHSAGLSCGMEDTGVRQRFRTDEVEVCWR